MKPPVVGVGDESSANPSFVDSVRLVRVTIGMPPKKCGWRVSTGSLKVDENGVASSQ